MPVRVQSDRGFAKGRFRDHLVYLSGLDQSSPSRHAEERKSSHTCVSKNDPHEFPPTILMRTA